MAVKLSVPRKFRRGVKSHDETASVQSGLKLLDLIEGIKPIEGTKLLDMGCGVKIAQALVERGSPQALYVGLDVYREMIEFMQRVLKGNDRYVFQAVEFHNEKYNSGGTKMADISGLPIAFQRFDLLTMFSVVTHLTPEDTRDMLLKLRQYAADDSALVFSTFVDPDQEEDFLDLVPEKPLFKASYRKAFLEDIIARTDWKIERYGPAINGVIMDYYVCSPA
ncbi:MAG: class I SAM-dependent methyltransferase [Pseudomonadota bacterium]